MKRRWRLSCSALLNLENAFANSFIFIIIIILISVSKIWGSQIAVIIIFFFLKKKERVIDLFGAGSEERANSELEGSVEIGLPPWSSSSYFSRSSSRSRSSTTSCFLHISQFKKKKKKEKKVNPSSNLKQIQTNRLEKQLQQQQHVMSKWCDCNQRRRLFFWISYLNFFEYLVETGGR